MYVFPENMMLDIAKRLKSVGVRYDINTYSAAGRCVLISDESLPKALAVLGINNSNPHYIGDNRNVILDMDLANTDAQPCAMTTPDWRGMSQSGFREASQYLADELERHVIISVPHRDSRELPQDDAPFQIFIWSTPNKDYNRSADTPRRMFGIEVDCRDSSYPPSGDGEPIVDPDTNHVVAELFENALYIHHDLCEHGTQKEINIFKKILEAVVSIRIAERDPATQDERLRVQYARMCHGRVHAEIAALESGIGDKQSHYKVAMQDAIRLEREVLADTRHLEHLHKYQVKDSERYTTELEALLALEKVKSVRVIGATLSVDTVTLYCDDPRTGVTHEMGEYRITVKSQTRDHAINWDNLSKEKYGKAGFRRASIMNAPHIEGSGRACFGNTAESFASLIAQYQFASAVLLAIQFVESVNVTDDWGKEISLWPTAPKEMQKKKKASLGGRRRSQAQAAAE